MVFDLSKTEEYFQSPVLTSLPEADPTRVGLKCEQEASTIDVIIVVVDAIIVVIDAIVVVIDVIIVVDAIITSVIKFRKFCQEIFGRRNPGVGK